MSRPGRPSAPDASSLLRRVAVVTGGLGSIGSAIVEALRRSGAVVVSADAAAEQHAAQLDLSATDHPTVRLDVTDRNAIAELFAEVERQCGPVTIVVNAAGVVSFGSAEALGEAEWDRVIDINLKGSFLVCQAALPSMKRTGWGRIVNVGSVVGKNAGNARPWLDPGEQARAGNVAYGVSKAGVHAMTGFLAKELAGFGITVNAVAPGPIATAMTTGFPDALKALIPVGRMGTRSDVAHATLFLCSADAGFISGEVLDVNGGMWCD